MCSYNRQVNGLAFAFNILQLNMFVFRKVDNFGAPLTIFWECAAAGLQREQIPVENLLSYAEGYACDCGKDDCFGTHGSCMNGVCACDFLYYGPACEHYRCQSRACYGHDDCHDPALGSSHNECNGGECVGGECVCDFGFTAESDCVRRGCPGDGQCSGMYVGNAKKEQKTTWKGCAVSFFGPSNCTRPLLN